MDVKTPAKVHHIIDGSTNLPHPGIPCKGPTPEQPSFVIMQPPPGIDKLINTHILKGAIRELAIPLVFNLCDLASRFVIEDVDLAVNGLFLANAFYNVACTQVHPNWVTTGSHFVVEALNFGEGGLEAVPLRFVLLAAYGFGDRVLEDTLVIPELKFLQRWATCK